MTTTQALVLAGHGSQRHPESAAPLHDHAERIRTRGTFDEVRTAFWKEEPPLWDAPAVVESDEAYVVPVLTSEGYFADRVFPRALGVDEDGRGDGPRLHYAEPVGTHGAMAAVVEERVESTLEGPDKSAGVALVGHGTERHERSGVATRRHAARLRETDRYAEVAALFLDESPCVGNLLDRLDAAELVVVPLFVADGHHTTRDIPGALGHPGVGTSAKLDGRLVHLTGAVGTEPRLADVVVERAVEAGARPRAGGDEGGPTDAEIAFRTMVDRERGPVEWGELAVERDATGYRLRHEVDVGVEVGSLEALDGTEALRRHVRRDDDGGYRPLTGERSLPAGWVVSGLDGEGLARAVRAVYPGSLTLWQRARAGRLDPTSFEETAARQTGVFAGLADIDGGELEAVTAAVCGDCVRVRRWPAEAGGEPPARASERGIPCREACPFLLAAARPVQEAAGDPASEASPTVPTGPVPARDHLDDGSSPRESEGEAHRGSATTSDRGVR